MAARLRHGKIFSYLKKIAAKMFFYEKFLTLTNIWRFLFYFWNMTFVQT